MKVQLIVDGTPSSQLVTLRLTHGLDQCFDMDSNIISMLIGLGADTESRINLDKILSSGKRHVGLATGGLQGRRYLDVICSPRDRSLAFVLMVS